MIDLHSHILPGIDDGALDLAASIEMARAFVADGVSGVACTPHILPGLYHNSGPQIRKAVAQLQAAIDEESIALQLYVGADNHIVHNFVEGIRAGHLLTLADTRYVLVEPHHHVIPPRMEELFFSILMAGYFPVLTHPERLTWVANQYPVIQRLAESGVWMQITAGSLVGGFGRHAKYWAERMLDEGLVHILASDAHDVKRRPPSMSRARDVAAFRVGEVEAEHLVSTRPRGILANVLPSELPAPVGRMRDALPETEQSQQRERSGRRSSSAGVIAGRLRGIFGK